MIKTIDDLRKCYAARADKEVFELFMDKCEEFGVAWFAGNEPRECWFGEAVVFDGGNVDRLGYGSVPFMDRKGYKRLTLSDFKRTRTEYVQVTDSIFDLRDEFERGELSFQDSEGDWLSVENECELAYLFDKGALYRRVEKVVDERQEFIDEALSVIDMDLSFAPEKFAKKALEFANRDIGKLYDSGKFKLVRANGEIE